MVPVKLKLEGFLSYRDAQEFDFEGRRLWMLSGDNGAGKSTVFDAMTFALFKTHRLGRQDADELINRQSDEAKVEFTFRVGELLYRAQRGVKRRSGSASRLLLLWDGNGWQPLDGSDGDAGFERHMSRVLGLNFEAFTASVLLRQGKSDQIIEALPSERFNLLKQIVDLAEYEALAGRAQTFFQYARQKHELCAAELGRIPVVTDEQVAAAEAERDAAETAKRGADEAVVALSLLRKQAEDFAGWESERTRLEGEVESARHLLAQANSVRARAARRRELDGACPLLARLLQSRREESAARERAAEADAALAAVRAAVRAALGGDVPGGGEGGDAARVEDALEARLRAADAARDDLPLLQQAARARADAAAAWAALRERRVAAEGAPEPHPFETAYAAEVAAEEAARAAHEAALQSHAAARAAANEAAAQRDRFAEAGDEGACRYCGQPLAPGQRARHAAELDALCRAAEDAARAAASDYAAAERSLKSAQGARARAQDDHARAVRAAQQARAHADAAEQAWSRAARAACEAAARIPAARLPAPSDRRRTVPAAYGADARAAADTDWLEDPDTFPSADDLEALTRRADRRKEWAALRERWRDASAEARYAADAASQSAARRARDGAALPPEWSAHPAAAAPDASAAALALGLLERERGEELARAAEELAALEEAERETAKKTAALTVLLAQIAALPDGAKRPVAGVRADLAAAGERQRAAEERARRAEQACRDHAAHREARAQKESEASAAANARDLGKLLAGLLGKDGLQRRLLRGAEAAIVANANRTLSAFSGGALRLEAARSEEAATAGAAAAAPDTALDLVCWNEDTADRPLPLRLLSGSQRFRVSVALALGIGQYALAGGGDGKVRSVIIDEGFGSLDARGLGDMAEEIKLLGGELERILVVSHQEAFAAAFPDRYHVRLEDGASRVERRLTTA